MGEEVREGKGGGEVRGEGRREECRGSGTGELGCGVKKWEEVGRGRGTLEDVSSCFRSGGAPAAKRVAGEGGVVTVRVKGAVDTEACTEEAEGGKGRTASDKKGG